MHRRGSRVTNDYCGLTCFRSESSWERSPCRLNKNRMARPLNPVRSGCKGHRAPLTSCQRVPDSPEDTWSKILFLTVYWFSLFFFFLPPFRFTKHVTKTFIPMLWPCYIDTGYQMTLIQKSHISCLSSTPLTQQLFRLTTVCLVITLTSAFSHLFSACSLLPLFSDVGF